MIYPPIPKDISINCFLVDVIRLTLASCDYRDCDEVCYDYLNEVSHTCPIVFHNEQYTLLWNSLFRICSDIDKQSHLFYIDN